MTTTVESNTNTLETFSLVWLDANNNIGNSRRVQQKLRSIINQVKLFQDPQKCQQYIEQSSKEDRLVLIVSGQMGRIVIPSIHRYQQVSSIYVYRHNTKNNKRWTSQFPKVRTLIIDSRCRILSSL